MGSLPESLSWLGAQAFAWRGGGVLSVLDRADLAGCARLTAGAKAEPRMSVAQEAIHTVRWSNAAPQPDVCAPLLSC